MTKADKKEALRATICQAAENYRDNLAGKQFLYVFDGQYIEVLYKKDRFSHLTGVITNLSGDEFFDKAADRTLSTGQFWFDKGHYFESAQQKCSCLLNLHNFTTNDIIVLKDMTTKSIVYKFAFTDINFTIGLTENIDRKTGIKINDSYLPRTLRVNDKAVENSADGSFADYIFSRDNRLDKYDTITLGDPTKINDLPADILALLDQSLCKEKIS
jgi:hypothetical protein